VKVKALPDKLPQQLTISVDPIVDFDTKLHVKDLTLPAGVTLLTDPEELLAHVLAPRVEEVETPTAAPAESGAPAAETPAASESEG
jgi:large subunit ribosomal protein L25